ncbi:hypothetical protein E2C01_048441 [Portunus trituberculatus]|uniref:Uncharacterized protein n=1 Tax=Portunus trituberculatus TaxID=210409 RepID=A0A5B7G362_PORTR|nr:hypothetical protein [Portunus trituberculatus]
MDDSDLEGYNSQEERKAGAKKKRYFQKYSKEFETDLQLKHWIFWYPTSDFLKILVATLRADSLAREAPARSALPSPVPCSL